MKIILLAVVATLFAIAIPLSYYAIYDSPSSVSCISEYVQIDGECLLKPDQYCKDWCDPLELNKLGCSDIVLDYIYRATNLFDENFNDIYYHDLIGLPDGMSEDEFEKCVSIIREKRSTWPGNQN